ncbi:hypothetical protein WJX74_010366 [Apatococcus lobatus]|uniref:Glycosyltransferase n=1 Tax=Apatococcus lobatus TaxID=904363 RepID=A0AAW1QJY4_9CHLO
MLRLLFVSLEFTAGTFSGNGIYAASQVQALARIGCQMLILAGKPAGSETTSTSLAFQLIEVELPTWGTLDRSCSWEAFAQACGHPDIADRVLAFKPDAALGIDWSSLPAFERLAAALAVHDAQLPYIYMNYRVYARTVSGADQQWMRSMELKAMETSALTIVLSNSDESYLQQVMFDPEHDHHDHHQQQRALQIEVLLPALRADMASISLPPDMGPINCPESQTIYQRFKPEIKRRYLTCCVRLSPEKEPDRFVDLVYRLHSSSALQRLKVTPLLIGSSKSSYAEGIKARLRSSGAPCEIVEQFLGPAELAEIFSRTRLNIHPCLYDAFGMSIVEAASQGAPSLTNEGGSIGATDLLLGSKGEVIIANLDMPMQELAQMVEVLLSDQAVLLRVGRAAAAKARSWTQSHNASKLHELLQNTCAFGR